MKVILLTDVKNVGKKDEIKEVADGYGRNYLIKNKLAVEASKRSMEILKKQQDDYSALQAQKKAEALVIKEKIEKEKLVFVVKAGADGRLFGSVSSGKICEKLATDYNINLDKKKFVDTDNLTKLGSYEVRVELFKDVIAKINVELVNQ